jgi:hypothetical protein
MLKLFILLALTIVICIQAIPAYCGVSRTTTFQLSVTIPDHVISNMNLGVTPFSNNPYQLVQTQTVTRNNKSISLISIVVP